VTTAAPERERPPRYANGLPDSFKFTAVGAKPSRRKRRYATHPPTAGVVLSEPHRFFATSRDAVRNRTADRSHATGYSGHRHSGGGRAAIDNSPASEMLDTASETPPISPAFGNPLQPARGARPAAETASKGAAPRSPAHTRIARAGVRPLHSPGSKCHGTSPHRAKTVMFREPRKHARRRPRTSGARSRGRLGAAREPVAARGTQIE
jgi:hypothetical protein